MLPSAGSTPSPDDTTVRTSNVTASFTPVVETVPDDDPESFDQGRDPDLNPLHQGWDYDSSISLMINAVDMEEPVFTPSADVTSEYRDVEMPREESSAKAILRLGVDNDPDAVRAQIDTGAWCSCSDQLHMLHDYKAFSDDFPCPVKLIPAVEGSELVPEGVGYLHIPAATAEGHIPVRTFFHPNLQTTVVNEVDLLKAGGNKPSDFSGERIEKFHDAGTCTFIASHRKRRSQDVMAHGILLHGKCYTGALIPPNLDASHPKASPKTSVESAIKDDPDFAAECERATIQAIYSYQEEEYATLRDELSSVPVMHHGLPFHEYIQKNTPVASIKAETERLLWHQRLGHPSDYYLYNAHKHIKGVPRFAHEHPILDKCPTCIQAKQTKESAGPNTTRTATVPYQGLSIDFSFSGVKSKDPKRAKDYIGLHGETCWISVYDHFSQRLHGDTRVSKGTPLSWMRAFLKAHTPRIAGKYVYLDQGGELYHNPEVNKLFKEFNYEVRPTGADASNQNGPVERSHRTVANAIRAMLHGANLDARFWPYAFHHYIRIKNALASRGQSASPLTLSTGKVDDFSDFRTFGCRVWVRPPGRRPVKLRPNSRKGIFLGFLPNTTKNVLWFDPETSNTKIAKHVRFDEGMNDLPFDEIPPNVLHLQRVRQGEPFPAESDESTVAQFEFTQNPFAHTISKTIKATQRDSTFGMELDSDILYNRAYVSDIKGKSDTERVFSSAKAARNKIKGAYIVTIDGERVFTTADAKRVLRRLYDEQVDEFEIVFAPEKRLSATEVRKALTEHDIFQPNAPEEEHVAQLTAADIRSIAAIRHPDTDFDSPSLTTDELHVMIQAMRSEAVTPEEQSIGRFTRRKLQKLATWPEWRAAEHKQLDHFHSLMMYGAPVPRPSDAIVLRPHWQYQVKRDGSRRSRNCCDGSPRAAPILHGIASTYSSCVEQPIQRLFFALSALKGYRVYGGDAQDAFAHSPPPDQPTYVAIDDAYADWYEERFKIKLDRSFVLPVLHALQGHPESGRLWEEHINKILTSPELGFRHTTHDRTIYTADFDGVNVLLLRQVDDFALACPDESLAKRIYDLIGKRLQLSSESKPPFVYLGLLNDFNGIDVVQSRDTVALTCRRYISRVLATHNWTTASRDDPDTIKAIPLSPDSITQLYKQPGPDEGTPEHAKLSAQFGFSFRTLLGELLYAYVTCRPDIGYAVTTLSKFSTKPSDYHYVQLRKVAKYLRQTINWGIIYHKPNPDLDLPPSPPTIGPATEDLPDFPTPDYPAQLLCFVDAAHANDLRNRRSTTGYAFTLCGGAVSYRTKTQSITATSSTEAEFLAAVLAAKHAKYLRAVLSELGFAQHEPTPIYEDNQSAILMINARVPTERSRHIDIQHFAIQDWKDNNEIVLRYIPGIINPSDDLTKPLGWILHSRHCRRLMGHYG